MPETGKHCLKEGTKEGNVGFKRWLCGLLFFLTLKPRLKISVFSKGIGSIKHFIKLIQNYSRQKKSTNGNQAPERKKIKSNSWTEKWPDSVCPTLDIEIC